MSVILFCALVTVLLKLGFFFRVLSVCDREHDADAALISHVSQHPRESAVLTFHCQTCG